HKNERQLRQSHYAYGVAIAKIVHDVAKIFIMVAGDDRNSIERWLKNIVAAAWHETATDKSDRRERVKRRQLTNCIYQEHAARQRFSTPERPAQQSKPELLHQFSDRTKTFGMARRQNHHRPRMFDQNIREGRQQRAFFVFKRAAADQGWAYAIACQT